MTSITELAQAMLEKGYDVPDLINEMIDGDYDNNSLLLGQLENSNEEVVQVQIIVTRNPEEFMDEL